MKKTLQTAPQKKSIVIRPWLWGLKILEPFANPIPVSLWFVNILFQRVLGLNNSTPWMVHYTSSVKGNIKIGKEVWKSFAISGGCYFQGGNGIEIDDYTIIGPGVKIISANHNPIDINKWIPAPPVHIGKSCWIGSNSVILPGVSLGDDVIVGAGSVVTKSFGNGCTIAGNPARIISKK